MMKATNSSNTLNDIQFIQKSIKNIEIRKKQMLNSVIFLKKQDVYLNTPYYL